MDHVFSVTLVRPSSGLPSVEVGAYEYVGAGLPWVGDTIPIRPSSGAASDVARGYVTRVDPNATNPISVTALPDVDDDVVVVPADDRYTPPPAGDAA
jgi:hypothetical protein